MYINPRMSKYNPQKYQNNHFKTEKIVLRFHRQRLKEYVSIQQNTDWCTYHDIVVVIEKLIILFNLLMILVFRHQVDEIIHIISSAILHIEKIKLRLFYVL